MFCAISGEIPQEPVASRKSGKYLLIRARQRTLNLHHYLTSNLNSMVGHVFEKRLIETYVANNGRDPVSGESLTQEDLIALQTSRVVRPRPPQLTSVPSLLASLQNEWDALALESYTVNRELHKTRQELSTALYQHDAALRVIARLIRERDEAKSALARALAANPASHTGKLVLKEGNSLSSNLNGDAMQIDTQVLPEVYIENITTVQSNLQSTRRKRPIPKGWATVEDFAAFESMGGTQDCVPGARRIVLDEAKEFGLVGGQQGVLRIFDVERRSFMETANVDTHSDILDVLWWKNHAILGLANGEVRIWNRENKSVHILAKHAAACTALDLHACGYILVSASLDKSYILYDLEKREVLLQNYLDSEFFCAQFHPDGHLLGLGGLDREIKLIDLKTCEKAAGFPCAGALYMLNFSENGTWLAAVIRSIDANSIQTDSVYDVFLEPHNSHGRICIWDLRKMNLIKEFDTALGDTGSKDSINGNAQSSGGGGIKTARFDYTGQYLSMSSASSIMVNHYAKSTKAWSQVLQKAIGCIDTSWGKLARAMIILTSQGKVEVWCEKSSVNEV